MAWAWLTRQIANLDEVPGRSVNREWDVFRGEEDGQHPPGTSLTDWPSDFWIAKSQSTVFGQMVGIWAIPERLDQWPAREILGNFDGTVFGATATNSGALLEALARTGTVHPGAKGDPARRFAALAESSTDSHDGAMISANEVRAWLAAAFGGMLAGIALTPARDDAERQDLRKAVIQRISGIDSLSWEDRKVFFFDYGCDTLYNATITPERIITGLSRQGQGEDWQHAWPWLSRQQDARAMQATLQLTGELLVNETILAGLASVIQDGTEDSRRRALCVTRRWLLTAKALAWLFEALRHDWVTVRPQDLACFTLSALSPAWPRRAVAISHRSAEVKHVLSQLKMWNSPHAAIDAAHVPSWETNTGMIWSLFASVPLLVRVHSPGYLESEWCRREHEMFQYLVDHADFVEGRAIIDIGADRLAELDAALFEDDADRLAEMSVALLEGDTAPSRPRRFPAPTGEFPPFSLVLLGAVPSDIDRAVLAAGGALRLIHALVRDPARANEIASHVTAGDDIGIEAPTNNPGGWAEYGAVLRDLVAACPRDRPVKRPIAWRAGRRAPSAPAPLMVPGDYSEIDEQIDRVSARQIPDLSSGSYRLCDVLAGFEWRRTVLEWFMDEGFGDKAAVDVSESDAANWSEHPRFSVARGLLALNSFSPTWIIQRAGQSAHRWPGFNEQPVFTRHVDGQFSWMAPVTLAPSWLIYYMANSRLKIGPSLQAAMIAAVVQSMGPEALKVDSTGANLIVPQPRDFLLVPSYLSPSEH
jgi:hypothetical protein